MDHGHVLLLDPFQVEREEVGPETVRAAEFEAGGRVPFVGTEDPAATFLAHIPLRVGVSQHGMFRSRLAELHECRIRFRDDVLMFHGDRRYLDAEQPGRPLRMVARGRDDMFGMDGDLFAGGQQVAALLLHLRGLHNPALAVPGIAVDLPLPFDGDAVRTGALGHRLGHVGGIYVAVGRVEDGALQVFGAHKRPAIPYLGRRHPFMWNATGLGGRRIEHVFVHPVLRLRHAQVADNLEAGIESGFLLKRLVEPDRIVVDMRRGIAHVEIWQESCRVPGRAGGQFVPLKQQHVLPACLGEMIGDRGTHGTAADDKGFDM